MTQRFRDFCTTDGYARWARRTDLPLPVLSVLFLGVLLAVLRRCQRTTELGIFRHLPWPLALVLCTTDRVCGPYLQRGAP